jgi:hypothetical protein
LVEVEVPLDEAEEVVDAGEGQDDGQQPPLELAQTIDDVGEVGVGRQPYERRRRERARAAAASRRF